MRGRSGFCGFGATLSLCVAIAAVALPARAQDVSEAAVSYVVGNVLSTFYHELGHAMIDVMHLPVLGQEEDAADILSVILTNDLWEEDMARQTALATAKSFWISAAEYEDDASSYADVHGLNLQRYYTHVCLFYGANPDARGDFLASTDLPADRAEGCADEYTLASESWGVYLSEIEAAQPGTSLRFDVDTSDSISILLADEIDALNGLYVLPESIQVELASCGEANAFYYPSDRKITICTEYVDALWDQAKQAGL